MKIIIAGYGYVGKAVANALKSQHEIVIHDPKYTDFKIIDHHDADGIIICVPTPTTEYGVCDASIVSEVKIQNASGKIYFKVHYLTVK